MAPSRTKKSIQARSTTRVLRVRTTLPHLPVVRTSPSRHALRSKGEPEAPVEAVVAVKTIAMAEVDERFPFMRLAPETRNAIYKLAYINDSYIGKGSLTISEFRKEASVTRNLPFSMTCRQIYEESAGIYFGYNGFSFETPDILLRFLQAIGIKNRERLTKLAYIHDYSFKWDEDPDSEEGDLRKSSTRSSSIKVFPALRYLRSCINLKTLDIYLLIEMNDFYSEAVRLEEAKKLFMTTSTIVSWGHPIMLCKVVPTGSDKDQFSEEAPSHVSEIGICCKARGYPNPKDFKYFTKEEPGAFQEYPFEEEAREEAQEEFTNIIRQLKTDTPTRIGSSRRFVYSLPNIFHDSKRKTEPYGTNFKTPEEKNIAKHLQNLVLEYQSTPGKPTMDVEYGDLVDAEEEDEVVDVVSDIVAGVAKEVAGGGDDADTGKSVGPISPPRTPQHSEVVSQLTPSSLFS